MGRQQRRRAQARTKAVSIDLVSLKFALWLGLAVATAGLVTVSASGAFPVVVSAD